ncbi:MAG: OmpA family protein [Lewinellaceae bacterium]|nr:OmpA family protein [Lewinellaceae bacterium]
MRILSLLLLTCCFAGKPSAQNLVLNPSFEQLKPRGISVPCQFSQYSSFFAEQIEVWTTYSYMTPDLLHAAENCSWLPQAHSGEYCAGIIHFLPGDDIGQEDDYHEKISGRLAAPLKPGRKYRLSCWVREDEAIIRDHLASVYTPKTPVVPLRAGNLGFYFTVAKARAEGIPQVVFTEPVVSNGGWVELSAVFVPDQPFQHFTVGNFFRDNQTKTDLPPEKHKEIEEKNTAIKFPIDRVKRAGYLCIDDVSIVVEPEPESTSRSLEDQLVKERKFTFSAGVLFDFDKADLRPEASPALDSLATFLKDHPGSKIGISGHTDDRGSEAYNLDLSGRRAKAVHDYLLENGIPAAQVEWKAFGKSRPVADNNTEEGRQMNRRVECILLKMR